MNGKYFISYSELYKEELKVGHIVDESLVAIEHEIPLQPLHDHVNLTDVTPDEKFGKEDPIESPKPSHETDIEPIILVPVEKFVVEKPDTRNIALKVELKEENPTEPSKPFNEDAINPIPANPAVVEKSEMESVLSDEGLIKGNPM